MKLSRFEGDYTITEAIKEPTRMGKMDRNLGAFVAFNIYSLLLLAAFVLFVSPAWAQITPSEAKRYIGKSETVCGQVASTNFAVRSKGQPTFLNLDSPYPNQVFAAVIWSTDREKFGTAPERTYNGRRICVTGVVSSYRGVPEIVVSDPSQIRTGN
jgi:hypothetical protein